MRHKGRAVTTQAVRGRLGLLLFLVLLTVFGISVRAGAAPYAAMVVDARNGKVLHSRNADTRLHPASLTKMMTLYVAFEAVANGELSMDTKIRISKHAAAEPPSKLGLKAGQKIALRYLVRAAAVKSANDAATAIAEGIAGSEAAFARRMNRTAKALGMRRTTFKNAHGLTEKGHLSTARDMTVLGRHLFYDYPDYYNLFSRRSTDAGLRAVSNTNRRLLDNYKGADGIKTGYTRAAGFNLVASAHRGRERIIATVFGGTSGAARNAKVAELLDLGFRRAPSRVAVVKPRRPAYGGAGKRVASASAAPVPAGTSRNRVSKTIRVMMALKTSLQPKPRPLSKTPRAQLVAMQSTIDQVVAGLAAEDVSERPNPDPFVPEAQSSQADALKPQPTPRPASTAQAPSAEAESLASNVAGMRPAQRPARRAPAAEPEVVTRMSASGGRHWGVRIGRFPSRYAAEKELLRTALRDMAALDGSLRKVVRRATGWEANFIGLSKSQASSACARISARGDSCETFGPT